MNRAAFQESAEKHSLWWGVVGRFWVIFVIGYLAALLIRYAIWSVVEGPYWGVWWVVPVHFVCGFVGGWIGREWLLGPRFWKRYG